MGTGRDLVIVTLAGVQTFISQSRTTRDLRAASTIMSELTGHAAASVDGLPVGGHDVRVVLPVPGSVAGLPNRLVLTAPAGSGPQVARQAVAAAMNLWDELRASAFGGQAPDTPGVPDVQWVVAPAAEHATYASQLDAAQVLAAGRKATRPFPAPLFTSGMDVCSLSPGWQAVKAPEGARPFERAEKLAAHNWVKRRYRATDAKFRAPSTFAIASAAFRLWVAAALRESRETYPSLGELDAAVDALYRRAPRPGTEGLLTALAGAAGPSEEGGAAPSEHVQWLLTSGGSWVHPSYWSVRRLEEAGVALEHAEEVLAAGVSAARAVLSAAGRAAADLSSQANADPPLLPGDPRLTPYLAVVVQDVDNLGDAIRAHLGSEGTAEEHRSMSEALVQRAVAHTGAAERALGWPVYAGGDDTLIMCPASEALGLVDELAIARVEGEPAVLASSTSSTAVAYVHAGAPLAASLGAARALLLDAKGLPGKNGVAVGYFKRSGSAATTLRPRVTDPPAPAGAPVTATGLLRHLSAGLSGAVSRRILADLSAGFDGTPARHPADPLAVPRPLLELGVPVDHTAQAREIARDWQHGEIRRLAARHAGTQTAQAAGFATAVVDALDTEQTARHSPTPALRVAQFLTTLGGVDG